MLGNLSEGYEMTPSLMAALRHTFGKLSVSLHGCFFSIAQKC